MVFTEMTFDYFSLMQSMVRAALAESRSETPFTYAEEPFFTHYNALYQVWVKRESQRQVSRLLSISRNTFKNWEQNFITHGALGLLPELCFVEIAPRLERLIVLVKLARPHENSSYTLRLANALKLPGASLERIRLTQRCHGYGHRMDENDRCFYHGLQRILAAVTYHKAHRKNFGHQIHHRSETFIDYDHDPFQQKVELFKTLSGCEKKRQIRPILQKFGIHPNRYYQLKHRYMLYGVWGLVDMIQSRQSGEKISAELELKIIEERLMYPSLSAQKMIKKLELKCSRANVLKVYQRWSLAGFDKSVAIRGVISMPITAVESTPLIECSARSRFPNLIQTANLKLNRGFTEFLHFLSYRSVPVSNPGAIIIAPFLAQFGITEALHTYGPPTYRKGEITNNILVNVLRLIVGFPTVNDFRLNTDRSVAIGAGLLSTPRKSRFYESFDNLRFEHLQKLRNDAACRAKELGIIDGKEIAIDYHCDPCDSRYPLDKMLSKSPDKNGNLVYAHRPQIIWDGLTHSIINIAYCEGASRAPTALYKFCEENLFNIIEPKAITEIYADSEYTGEKQLVYLIMKSDTEVTMCLKQNKKIKKWKEETIKMAKWIPYQKRYRLASGDYTLPESGKPFRFVVKQNIETNETRCFGSTHTDLTPLQILDRYHLRWTVETGLRDLVENYFLDKPTGTSPEKIELHYYCVMLARLVVDYFLSIFCEPRWQSPEEWDCVISTVRTTLFSNQNCELTRHPSGNLQLTYLDGDPLHLKEHLKKMLLQRLEKNLNKVPWWGNLGVRIKIKDCFNFANGSE